MLGKPGIRVRIPIRRVVLEPTQERVVGTDEKLRGTLESSAGMRKLPFTKEGPGGTNLVADGVVWSAVVRPYSLWGRYE